MASSSKKSSNTSKMDKLLSVAYSECSGTKSGEKELAFIGSVFDFLNRQSTYLSDPKVADQLTQLTAQTISAGSKKGDAINKKKRDKKKRKKEPGNTKGGAAADDIEAKSVGKKKGKKKKGKTNGSNTGKSTKMADDAEAKETEMREEAEDTVNVVDRVEAMFVAFTFDVDKDYKSWMKMLAKRASTRSAAAYLVEVCKVIWSYAPSVAVSPEATKSIVGTDRAFRVSTNFQGKIYISDFEMAYQLVAEPKNDKVLNAELVSNHPVCVHDASSVYCDHRSNVFFHEKTTFKNESLSVIIPGKPTPKRALQYKPLGIFMPHDPPFNVFALNTREMNSKVTWFDS